MSARRSSREIRTTYPDQSRNMNPTPEAVIAIHLWGDVYAHEFRGGSMDFWDSLDSGKRKRCLSLLACIEDAQSNHSKQKVTP